MSLKNFLVINSDVPFQVLVNCDTNVNKVEKFTNLETERKPQIRHRIEQSKETAESPNSFWRDENMGEWAQLRTSR